jgi:hypothetical protein
MRGNSEGPSSDCLALILPFSLERNVTSNARFDENSSDGLDLSSFNFAVAADRCNIHVDQIGFVIGRARSEVIVDPDFAQHLVNELLWKSLATKVFPDTFVDRVSIMLPSSANEYSRAGISADLRGKKTTV